MSCCAASALVCVWNFARSSGVNQVRSRRAGYLVAAVCLAVCLVTVLPLVMAVLNLLEKKPS